MQNEEAPYPTKQTLALEPLSPESKHKAAIIRDLLDTYRKSHYIADDNYGTLFDMYYSKDLYELVSLHELFK